MTFKLSVCILINILSFCSCEFLDNFQPNKAKAGYVDISNTQGLLISPSSNNLLFRTFNKETHQFSILDGKSLTYGSLPDNVNVIKTKGGQIIVIWRVVASSNLSTLYALFMDSQSFNTIKQPFKVSTEGNTDAKDNLQVIDLENNEIGIGWSQTQGQNTIFLLQKYSYDGTPIGSQSTLSTHPSTDIIQDDSQNAQLTIIDNKIQLTQILKSEQVQRLKSIQIDKTNFSSSSEVWVSPETQTIANHRVLKMSNDQIGYFWQVLSDQKRPLRIEYTIKNISQNTFATSQVLPIKASYYAIGDYSVKLGANNILIYDQIVIQNFETVNDTKALYQNIIKDGILIEESIPVYKDFRSLSHPFTIETKSNDIIAPNKRMVLCKVEGANDHFSQYYSSLPKQVIMATGCSRYSPTFILKYRILDEIYDYHYLKVAWEAKSSNPSPKLEEKLKISNNLEIELENGDLVPNTQYSINAYHSTRGIAQYNFTTDYGPYLFPEICYQKELLDAPIIDHSCKDDEFLIVNTTLGAKEKPYNSNITLSINSDKPVQLTPNIQQLSRYEAQIPLKSLIPGVPYLLTATSSLGSVKQIQYAYYGSCDADNSTGFNISQSNLFALIISYIIILLLLNFLQRVSKQFNEYCILSKFEQIKNPSWLRKLFTLIMNTLGAEINIFTFLIPYIIILPIYNIFLRQAKKKVQNGESNRSALSRLCILIFILAVTIGSMQKKQLKSETKVQATINVKPPVIEEIKPEINEIEADKDFYQYQEQIKNGLNLDISLEIQSQELPPQLAGKSTSDSSNSS